MKQVKKHSHQATGDLQTINTFRFHCETSIVVPMNSASIIPIIFALMVSGVMTVFIQHASVELTLHVIPEWLSLHLR